MMQTPGAARHPQSHTHTVASLQVHALCSGWHFNPCNGYMGLTMGLTGESQPVSYQPK